MPKGIDKSKLFRWSFVYLDGKAEAPSYKVDPPDIFLSDTPLESVNDGITTCYLHIKDKVTECKAFLWSHSCKVVFTKGKYKPMNCYRHGLVVASDDEEAYERAYSRFSDKAIDI